MVTDQLLERMRSIAEANYPKIKDRLPSIEQVFVLHLNDGGNYVVRANNASLSVEPGTHGSPAATITTSSEDLRAILDGRLDAAQAFFQGKLQVRGDIFKMMAFNSLLKGVS
jgi:putative sterol carrier protein